jgi:hypothetical protein
MSSNTGALESIAPHPKAAVTNAKGATADGLEYEIVKVKKPDGSIVMVKRPVKNADDVPMKTASTITSSTLKSRVVPEKAAAAVALKNPPSAAALAIAGSFDATSPAKVDTPAKTAASSKSTVTSAKKPPAAARAERRQSRERFWERHISYF